MFTPELHSKQWFLDRIGKRIFRSESGCHCLNCKDVLENGLIILNEQQADTLFYTEHDYAQEGIFLRYRDQK